MDLPVNPLQYSYPSFMTRKKGTTGEQEVSIGNPNGHMGKGNDESMASLRVVEPNNRAKKDVGNKQRHKERATAAEETQ